MAKKQGKSYSGKFKFQVVLEALTSEENDAETARKYEVHPVTLSNWKRQFMSRGPQIFSTKTGERALEKKIERLERLLGRKEVELALAKNFLKKT